MPTEAQALSVSNGMENSKIHSLGHRAFFLFLLKRIKLAAFLFVLWGAAVYAAGWLPQEYAYIGIYITEFLLVVSASYFAIILLLTYFEYRYYTYSFSEEAFVMTYGYVMRNEVAALYHQIQNVNIVRRPLDRMVGVSQVVIFMSGSEREASHDKIVLPAVGKTKAKQVQKELLMRARRHITHPHSPAPNGE
jgi:membrane protein YdbS with pleckstrin-like domain